MSEEAVEKAALVQFRKLGWSVSHGNEIASGEPNAERDAHTEVVLKRCLQRAVRKLNTDLSEDARDEAIRRVLHRLPSWGFGQLGMRAGAGMPLLGARAGSPGS